MEQKISTKTLQRLPIYLNLLKQKQEKGVVNISAGIIAEELGLVEIQVRKDLASVSKGGKPKIGYVLSELAADIELALGYGNKNDAVLIGAGKLGKALLGYNGFKEYGLNIVAAFDTDKSAVGTDENGTKILHADELEELCRRMNIRIGIITVPAQNAQAVCDRLINVGVIAVWNFAPTHLKTPAGILVKNENMAVSLAELSKHLTDSISKDKTSG